MSELDVLKSLLEWTKKNFPKLERGYYLSKDRKVYARALLRKRLKLEPSYIFVIPSDLLYKLNFQIVFQTDDHKVLALAKTLKGKVFEIRELSSDIFMGE